LAKGTSCPFANLPHPCGNPNGLFPTTASVLGAADGGMMTHSETPDNKIKKFLMIANQLRLFRSS
jgi:hypothetical protein